MLGMKYTVVEPKTLNEDYKGIRTGWQGSESLTPELIGTSTTSMGIFRKGSHLIRGCEGSRESWMFV